MITSISSKAIKYKRKENHPNRWKDNVINHNRQIDGHYELPRSKESTNTKVVHPNSNNSKENTYFLYIFDLIQSITDTPT